MRYVLIRNIGEFFNGKSFLHKHTWLLIKGGFILRTGGEYDLVDIPENAEVEIIDAQGGLVTPGFIDAHDHLFQSATKDLSVLHNISLGSWIKRLIQIIEQINPELLVPVIKMQIANLLLSGCTTILDFPYLFPNHNYDYLEMIIHSAQELGIRLHLVRGCLNHEKIPEDVRETTEQFITHTEELVQKYHNPAKNSKLRIGIGPCSIPTNQPEDYQQSAELAGKYGILLHTHIAETYGEIYKKVTYPYSSILLRQTYEFYNSPIEFLLENGWTENLSIAHGIYLPMEGRNSEKIRLQMNKFRVVHCPMTCCRQEKGSHGQTPIYEMLKAKIPVGIGCDGLTGPSNYIAHLSLARLLQGSREQVTYLNPKQTLYMATLGGAYSLEREDELGYIKPGYNADLVIIFPEQAESLGYHSVASALTAGAWIKPDIVIIQGRIVAKNNQLISTDIRELAEQTCESMRNIKEVIS